MMQNVNVILFCTFYSLSLSHLWMILMLDLRSQIGALNDQMLLFNLRFMPLNLIICIVYMCDVVVCVCVYVYVYVPLSVCVYLVFISVCTSPCSYGQKSASQLLLHYGFIPKNFGMNTVRVYQYVYEHISRFRIDFALPCYTTSLQACLYLCT